MEENDGRIGNNEIRIYTDTGPDTYEEHMRQRPDTCLPMGRILGTELEERIGG